LGEVSRSLQWPPGSTQFDCTFGGSCPPPGRTEGRNGLPHPHLVGNSGSHVQPRRVRRRHGERCKGDDNAHFRLHQHSRIGHSDTTAGVARAPPVIVAGSSAFLLLRAGLRLNTPSIRSTSWSPLAMNFLAQLGSSPRRRPSLPWKQARRKPCQRCPSDSNIVGPMAVTFTQPNIVACTLRGDPSEIHSASQTGSSARFGAASIASSDAGCGARHTRNLPQGARLSATCSKRMSRKNALANLRAQPELPTADHALPFRHTCNLSAANPPPEPPACLPIDLGRTSNKRNDRRAFNNPSDGVNLLLGSRQFGKRSIQGFRRHGRKNPSRCLRIK